MANCMKCGKELAGVQVFCDECLAVMRKYPVPAGTPLNIPNRNSGTVRKQQSKKKTITPEETVIRQRRVIQWLMTVLTVLMILAAVMLMILIREWKEPNIKPEETKGQNYSTQTGGGYRYGR